MNKNTTLSKDDIDTICIHLNAFKENLCNQGRYCEAEEYQQIIDKVQNLSKEKTIFLDKETKEDESSRELIRKLVRNIFREAVYLDTMMEFEDQKNPDSVIALNVKEENEIYSLFDEVSKLSKYLVYHGLWKEDYNGLCLGIKNRLFTEEKTAKVVNYVCDHCGFWLTDGIMDYCPGCGAKLEWKNEEH